MRNLRILAVMAAATVWGGCASTAIADDKIAYANPIEIIASVPQARAAQEALKAEFAEQENELMQLQNALRENTRKLQEGAFLMPDGDRLNLERTMNSQRDEIDQRTSRLQSAISRRRGETMDELHGEVKDWIEQVRVDEGYTYVLSADHVLAAPDALDITDLVIARMSEE